MDAHHFIARLESAFQDQGCPPSWLPTCSCQECTELAAFLGERPRWRHLTAEDCFGANMTSLMGKAFSYYLPAYIVASLTEPEAADIAVDFSAWRFLSYPPDVSPNQQLFLSFTPEQQLLILEWLEWYAETQSVDEEQRDDYVEQIKMLRSSAL